MARQEEKKLVCLQDVLIRKRICWMSLMLDGGEDAGRGSKQAKSRLVRVPCFALVELAFFRLNAAADEVPEGRR